MSYDPYVGSINKPFPRDFLYSEQGSTLENGFINEVHEDKPRIHLMGLRRSGKSSIAKVVFHKMSPNETLFLESTHKIIKDDVSNSTFVQFQIWDFPGQLDLFDPQIDFETMFKECDAIIFVIDAQDDYREAIEKLQQTVGRAFQINQNIKFEVFIHKVDGLTDDQKYETQREVHQMVNESLDEDFNIQLSYYLTSIYDHSIFEAFSKVVQKLIPQLPTLEHLINVFCLNSGMEKAFLFDVVSKIYIATDFAPVDIQTYELCCDMIDVVVDVSCIYGASQQTVVFDDQSYSMIRLNNSNVLYLREVNRYLALVCLLREEKLQRQGIIDFNFNCFRDAVQEVFDKFRTAQAIAGGGSGVQSSFGHGGVSTITSQPSSAAGATVGGQPASASPTESSSRSVKNVPI